MSRIDLQVPFIEKEEARSLGARWDPSRQFWYVPGNVDPAPLRKMNHCEHCTAKLGDFDTVCEYDAAFSPRTTERAAQICLTEIAEPFFTSCRGYTYIEWLEDAQRQGTFDEGRRDDLASGTRTSILKQSGLKQ